MRCDLAGLSRPEGSDLVLSGDPNNLKSTTKTRPTSSLECESSRQFGSSSLEKKTSGNIFQAFLIQVLDPDVE